MTDSFGKGNSGRRYKTHAMSHRLHVHIDPDTWDEFVLGLKLAGESIPDWARHHILLSVIKNRPLVEKHKKDQREWKKNYFNIQE